MSEGDRAMVYTPAKVAEQPYRNVTIWWKDAFWKSPYSIADPTIAERLNKTN